MDPAALGTLMIGLESVRKEQELGDAPALPRRKSRGHALRVTLATALRGLADLIEPQRRSANLNRA